MFKLQVSTGDGCDGEPTQYFDTFEDALEATNEVYFDGHTKGGDPLTEYDIRDWYDYDCEKYHLKVYILDEDDNFLLDWSVYKHFKRKHSV